METTLTARSVILSLLLGTRPASLPVQDLVHLGQQFGIAPPTLRVALSRMVASGDLTRSDAIHALSDRHLARQAAQDADLDPELRPFEGSWDQFIVTASGRDATTRADVRARLTSLRLAELREGVWLRPANLLLVDAVLPGVEHFTVRPDDGLALVDRLWDTSAWTRGADRLLLESNNASTLRERFVTMTEVVRHLRADPCLPPALQPTSWPATELRRAYEKFRADLTTLRSPLDTMTTTHDVTNQVPPLVDHDASDYAPYTEALTRAGASDALDDLRDVGELAGSAHAQDLGDLAEAHQPVLHTHDRYGNRIDQVVYDPSYHELMSTAVGFGLHGSAWAADDPHAHLVRATKMSVWMQTDAGHACPISMTYAAIPALRTDPAIAAQFEPLLTNRTYDPSFSAPATKRGLIAGMSMTEKQGGSDVRANTTSATPQADGTYRITGHKWFTSAPMSDVLLTLAQTPAGVTCFVLPRVLPDGTPNAISLQRLKNKLGNQSNASAEIEYDQATGWRLGDEGRGVRTIVEMVNMTRLDCTLGSASGMRVATQAAAHHAAHRSAFGATLADQPLMRNVLADLAVEAEASTTVALWLADLTDQSVAGDAHAAVLRRISLAASKYYVCKRAPAHAAEALECLGGNGYVDESRMPRLYREAPLMSIWEGSGNVAALDTLRAIARQPETLTVFFDELDRAAGADTRLDDFVTRLKSQFTDGDDLEHRARRVVGDLAIALQGSLLVRHGNPAVADAFAATRLDRDWGTVFGTLPTGINTAPIIARCTPKIG